MEIKVLHQVMEWNEDVSKEVRETLAAHSVCNRDQRRIGDLRNEAIVLVSDAFSHFRPTRVLHRCFPSFKMRRRSCPQAPSMSAPISRLTVAEIPCASR